MNEFDSYLVTLLYNGELIRCAVKTKLDFLKMTKTEVWARLPMCAYRCGPVVKVERIFDVAVLGGQDEPSDQG